MKKITAYQLSNGSIEKDPIEAKIKQKEITLTEQVEAFCKNHVPYTDHQEICIDAILENKKALYEILYNYFEDDLSLNK